MVELLAPVGNFEMLVAAVKAKADAVYFGVKGLNMRAAASNFSLAEIKKVVNYCHKYKVKAYCTVNVIIFENELKLLDKILNNLKEANIDAVICWDLAVIKKCKELKIPIHLSTQASVSNTESAKYWKQLGIERIVLARECSFQDIKKIKDKSGLEIEVFVHGARCISLSGRCFMSYDLFGKSANRGECIQVCRRDFKVTDEEGKEMKLTNNYVMSAKDLCTLTLLPKILKKKVDCLKIEGRNRGAEYVFKVVSVYRRALTAIEEKRFTSVLQNDLMQELKEVYNKDYSQGFFVDYPYHQRCDVYGNKSISEKVLIGKVSNYYPKIKVVEFKVDSEEFKIGDKLAFIGPTTGYEEIIVEEIHDNNGKTEKAVKGKVTSVKVNSKIRENDKVYLLRIRE